MKKRKVRSKKSDHRKKTGLAPLSTFRKVEPGPKLTYVAPPAWEAPPTRWRGMVVPFVAAWSSERTWIALPERSLGGKLALFSEQVSPRGTPLLGKMDPRRQRLCMLDALCQVCANPLGRWRWSPALGRAFVTEAKKLQGDGFLRSEPMSCRSCAALSSRICPALRRMRPSWQAVKTAHLLPQVMDGEAMKREAPDVWKGAAARVYGHVEYLVTESHEWHEFDAFLELTKDEVDLDEVAAAHAVLSQVAVESLRRAASEIAPISPTPEAS